MTLCSTKSTNNPITRSSVVVNSFATGILYGLAMFGIGFILGTIRVFAVIPLLPEENRFEMDKELYASLWELPIMLVICWHLCQWILRRAGRRNRDRHDLKKAATVSCANDVQLQGSLVGLTALVALLLCEVGMTRSLLGLSWAEVPTEFASIKGLVGLATQTVCSFYAAVMLWRQDRRIHGAGKEGLGD